MDSEQKGNRSANRLHRMSDYGIRAAAALNDLLPGEHRDKWLARKFNVSLRTAKYLRAGEHWTLDRLSQASDLLGAAFDAAVATPVSDAQHLSEMDEINERVARLEACFGGMDRRRNAQMASEPGAAVTDEGGMAGASRRMGPGRRAADRQRAAAQGEGPALARPVQRREVK